MSPKSILSLMFLFTALLTSAQKPDSIESNFSTYVSITNNGISFIPTFSYEKPAGTVIISMGGRRLSFEPDFRFTLDMERGGIAFWWRYKMIMRKKFSFNVGAHPGLNMIPLYHEITGEKTGTLETQRFVAGEIAPTYSLSRNISLGIYYLYGHGFQDNAPRNAHFMTVSSSITNIPLFFQLKLQLVPQVYYLIVDVENGFYFTNTLTISRPDFPFMIQSTINKIINTNITGSKDFQWNVSLSYFLSKKFISPK